MGQGTHISDIRNVKSTFAQLAISIGSVILGKLCLKSGCNGLTDEQSAQKIGFKFSWPLAFMTLWPLALEPL